MATKTEKYTFNWENGKSFELKCKEDDKTEILVVRVEENSNMNEIWPSVEAVCTKFILNHLTTIGNEMKARNP